MEESQFNAARSRISAELKMFILDIGEMGLDADTAEFVSDGAAKLITQLDRVVEEEQLERIETGLGRLQIAVRQALKREGSA